MYPRGHTVDEPEPDGDTSFDLPELPPLPPTMPLARPGLVPDGFEESRVQERREQPPLHGQPQAGGGSSLTAADDRRAFDPRGEETFTRELAARLTAGMLANPGRGSASVKDAMALYDHVLQEMRNYVRVSTATEAEAPSTDRYRRRESKPRTPHRAEPPAQPRPVADIRPMPYRRPVDSEASDIA